MASVSAVFAPILGMQTAGIAVIPLIQGAVVTEATILTDLADITFQAVKAVIVVVYTADNTLKTLLAEIIGILIKAFAAIVAYQICAVSAVVRLAARIWVTRTLIHDVQTFQAHFTVSTVLLGTETAKKTLFAQIVSVLQTGDAMLFRGAPAILAKLAFGAHIRQLTVIARLAAYTDVVNHTHIAVVIATAKFVFVYRARRCFHKTIAARTV